MFYLGVEGWPYLTVLMNYYWLCTLRYHSLYNFGHHMGTRYQNQVNHIQGNCFTFYIISLAPAVHFLIFLFLARLITEFKVLFWTLLIRERSWAIPNSPQLLMTVCSGHSWWSSVHYVIPIIELGIECKGNVLYFVHGLCYVTFCC